MRRVAGANRNSHDATPAPGARSFRYTARVGGSIWPTARVGGKANGLHRLVREGLEVPPAFCILSDAFEQALAECVDRVDSLDGLREKLLRVELDDELIAEIDAQMRAIEPQWPTSTDALREVWASLYETGALLYHERLAGDAKPRAMAVVVQRMISACTAGVIFSQNPLNADADQLVVNAAKGPGQQVVEGHSAETYYLEKSSAYVERYEPAEVGEDAQQPLLDAAQLKELADCARQLERAFSAPQDIEWAFAPRVVSASLARAENAHGIRPTLYLLQARPITASASPAAGASAKHGGALWSNVNVGEALPGVATPLTWSIIRGFSRLGFERAFGSLGLDVPAEYELVGSFRGRVYLNLSQFMSIASAIPLLRAETLFEMAGGVDMSVVQGHYAPRSSRDFVLHLPKTALKVLASQLSTPLVAPLWERYFKGWRDRYFEQDLTRLSHREFRDKLGEIDRVFERTG